MNVKIFSDGSCSQNATWCGGWGYVVTDEQGNILSEGAGYVPETTNQRMEIQSFLEGIKSLKEEGCLIDLTTDSMYVVNTVNKWLRWWLENGSLHEKKNVDLWQEFIEVMAKHKGIRAHHVKGHSGHPLNEKCNTLAQDCMREGQSKRNIV